jgi:hypothetical protein
MIFFCGAKAPPGRRHKTKIPPKRIPNTLFFFMAIPPFKNMRTVFATEGTEAAEK